MANKYIYLARNKSGQTKHGEITASSINLAKFTLRKQGLWVININQKADKVTTGKKKKFRLFGDRVGLKDMVIFSRQFAAMIEAGVAMLRALSVLVEQTENPKLSQILSEIKVEIEQGKALSETMKKYPEVFDRLYVAMIRAGETGGVLDKVLNRLAGFMESRNKLTQKVKTAMTYPVVVIVIAIGVTWFMLANILPQFSQLFEATGGELPAYTQFLIDLSDFIRSPWMLIIASGIWLAFTSLQGYYKTQQGRVTIDGFLLSTPVFGDLLKKVSVARFTRTFGTLIQSGVPMITALTVVKDSANNAIMEGIITEVQKEVEEGGTLSTKLAKSDVFPEMVTQMIAIGEESGELENMLEKVADFYDTEVDNAVETLSAIMEPFLVVIIGGIVLAILVGMYLPIFTIFKQF